MNSSLFGSAARDAILKFLALVEQSYPSELAAALDLRLYAVQRAVDSLQGAGMLSSRLVGGVRIVQFNRTWFAKGELRSFLLRLAQADERIRESASTLRKRPRRAGKEL